MSNTDLLRKVNSTSLAVDEEEDDIAAVPLSIEQKMEMLNCMRQFIEEKGMESAMPTLRAFEKTVFSEATKTRQTTLDSFFNSYFIILLIIIINMSGKIIIIIITTIIIIITNGNLIINISNHTNRRKRQKLPQAI
ncbi:hypothetical protein ElyMa_005185300 [Elysia marginata]|uniref:LisH domain-containing protein n=1 Tax=Elysia marginata TaxID=1093978 RepID=A0AAV4JU39_9GAST|nr:hypothetical protein ElyMa_005185300 [Elysia marginata]